MQSWDFSKGDISFDKSGYLKLIDNGEELLQNIKLELETNLGEWKLNTKYGIPWLQGEKSILGKRDNREIRKQIIQEVNKILEKREEIKEIKEIEVKAENRKVFITIIIKSIYGIGTLEVEVGDDI